MNLFAAFAVITGMLAMTSIGVNATEITWRECWADPDCRFLLNFEGNAKDQSRFERGTQFSGGGTMNYVPGKFNQGLDVTPTKRLQTLSNDNGSAANAVIPNGSMGMTMQAWVNPSAATAQAGVVGKVGNYRLRLRDDAGTGTSYNVVDFRVEQTSGGAKACEGGANIPVGQWTHVAVTYDVHTNTGVVYVNGVETPTGCNATLLTDLGDQGSAGRIQAFKVLNVNWTGILDDVAIYSRVKDPAEIAADAFFPPSCASCTDFMDNILAEVCTASVPGSLQGLKDLINSTIAAEVDALGGICAGDASGATTEAECEEYIRGILLATPVCDILSDLF